MDFFLTVDMLFFSIKIIDFVELIVYCFSFSLIEMPHVQ